MSYNTSEVVNLIAIRGGTNDRFSGLVWSSVWNSAELYSDFETEECGMMTRKDCGLSATGLLLMAGLSGCIGGGSDGNDMDAGDSGDRMPGDGGVASGPVTLMAGVDRLFADGETVLLADDGMTIVEETDSGWNLTVNGRTAALVDSNKGAHPLLEDNTYFAKTGVDQVVAFWSLDGSFDEPPAPRFDYLNVYGFAHNDLVPGGDISESFMIDDFERADYVFIVHGTPTRAMPVSGTATYNGNVSALEWSSNTATLGRDSTRYRGDFSMTADFGASGVGVSGEFSNLEQRMPGGDYTSIPDTIPFSTTVDGNQLSVSGLSISAGSFAGYEDIGIRGAFFGPDAAEAGGVFEGENPAANTLLHGWFAGSKEE